MLKKREPAICVVMKKREVFWVLLVLNHHEMQSHVLPSANYESALSELLKPYPSVTYCLLISPDDYSTLLVNNHQLNATEIQKSIRYLVAETSNFEMYDDWLLYFPSLHPESLQVMSASPIKIRENIHPLALEKFSCIDCFDHAVANAVVFAGFGLLPTVVITHDAGLVRCILIENHEVRLIQETALFEQTGQHHSEQLTQRLLHYFQPYYHKDLLFLTLDPQCMASNMPEKWQYNIFDLSCFSSLMKNQPVMYEHLPLIGAGLYHATSLS